MVLSWGRVFFDTYPDYLIRRECIYEHPREEGAIWLAYYLKKGKAGKVQNHFSFQQKMLTVHPGNQALYNLDYTIAIQFSSPNCQVLFGLFCQGLKTNNIHLFHLRSI